MWLVSKPISCFCYEQGNPACVSTITGMLARISARKPFALTWIRDHYLSLNILFIFICSSRTLELALFVGTKYLVILQSLWGRNLFNRILDGTNHICHKEMKSWSGRKELLIFLSIDEKLAEPLFYMLLEFCSNTVKRLPWRLCCCFKQARKAT